MIRFISDRSLYGLKYTEPYTFDTVINPQASQHHKSQGTCLWLSFHFTTHRYSYDWQLLSDTWAILRQQRGKRMMQAIESHQQLMASGVGPSASIRRLRGWRNDRCFDYESESIVFTVIHCNIIANPPVVGAWDDLIVAGMRPQQGPQQPGR